MDVKQKPYSDPSRWICIYPAYIDKKKSIGQGRQIQREKAVMNPTSLEIFEIINNMGLKCELEKNKMYSRDCLREPNLQGRVRFQLFNDDGSPINTDYPTRKKLLLYLAEMMPKLKSRQNASQDHQFAGSANKQKKKK